MKTYFDYSEKERSELTSERVRELLKFELMEQGVQTPEQPVRQPVSEPTIQRHRKFEVQFAYRGRYGKSKTRTSFCFDTIEQAEAFMRLNPQPVDYDYQCGEEYAYFAVATELSAEARQLCSQDDVDRVKAMLTANSEAKKANEEEDRKYTKALDAVQKATEHIWSDWHEACAKSRSMAKVRSTWHEYLESCEQNATVAEKFFRKLYSQQQMDEAFEWFGESLPGVLCEAQPMPVDA